MERSPAVRRHRKNVLYFAAFFAVTDLLLLASWSLGDRDVPLAGGTFHGGVSGPVVLVAGLLTVAVLWALRAQGRVVAAAEAELAALPATPGRVPGSWGLDPATAEATLRDLAVRTAVLAYAAVARGGVPPVAATLVTPELQEVLDRGTEALGTPGYRSVVGGMMSLAGTTPEGLAEQLGPCLLAGGGTVRLDPAAPEAKRRVGQLRAGLVALTLLGGRAMMSSIPESVSVGNISGEPVAYDPERDVLAYRVTWAFRADGRQKQDYWGDDASELARSSSGDSRYGGGRYGVTWELAPTPEGPRACGFRDADDGCAILSNLLEMGRSAARKPAEFS